MRRYFFITALFAGVQLVAAGFVFALDLPVFSLLEQAQVSGVKILVEDVARINGMDNPQQLRNVMGVEIGKAAMPGRQREINLDYLKIKLRENGINPEAYVFKGSQRVVVNTSYKLISGREIFAEAKQYVLKVMPWAEADVVIEAGRMPKDVFVADTETSIEIYARPGIKFQGRMLLNAKIRQNLIVCAKVPVCLNLKRFGDVLVSQRRFEKGELIAQDAVYVRRDEISNQRSNVLSRVQDVVGKQARRLIRPEQIICANMVQKQWLVKRNYPVTILIETQAMKVTAKGCVCENGAKGEMVRVKNIVSKKDVYAQVISSSLVRVPMGRE
ncbi:MAG: flagella basal body P-ring formation protein FlgA [Candidatus Omnitrophota bacterium]|nr:MAG: flagella basal body P-ring formation protein FlgA [Candidatus Omnitrophota bacterium]